MTARVDPRALTRELLRFNTINPPGMERACARHLGAMLEDAGFRVAYHEFAEVAHQPGGGDRRRRRARRRSASPATSTPCRSAPRPGRSDAFAGETDGDRVYGRGSTDMKSGIAAFVAAAIELAPQLAQGPGPGAGDHRRRGDRLRRRALPRRPQAARRAPAPSSWPSPPPTTRTSATRASPGSRSRPRASPRTARCPRWATTPS